METNVMTRPTMDEWDKRQRATTKKAARKAGKKAPQAKRGNIGNKKAAKKAAPKKAAPKKAAKKAAAKRKK